MKGKAQTLSFNWPRIAETITEATYVKHFELSERANNYYLLISTVCLRLQNILSQNPMIEKYMWKESSKVNLTLENVPHQKRVSIYTIFLHLLLGSMLFAFYISSLNHYENVMSNHTKCLPNVKMHYIKIT